MNKDADRLVVLGLKFEYRGISLSKALYSDFALKALYQAEFLPVNNTPVKQLSTKKIRKSIAKMLSVNKVSTQIVDEALAILSKNKKILPQGNQWKLSASAKKEISRKLSEEESLIKGVLARHFPDDVEPEILESWFYEASTEVFSEFGDTIVANITGKKLTGFGHIDLSKIVKSTSSTHGIGNKKAALLAGYQSFISSSSVQDHPLIMQLAMSGFAARLVAANLGADPLSLEQLRGATLLLDTNMLFNIKLRRKLFAKPMSMLGVALKEIDVKLAYLPLTREEYIGVINYAESEVMKLLENYELRKIKKLELDDDFIKAGIEAGCKDADDFKEFFVGLRDVPEKIESGPDIKLLADDVTEEVVDKAMHDTRLKNMIRSARLDLKNKESKENSLNHDAALLRVSEVLINEDPKGWALSMDTVLKYVAISVAGKGLPSVMGLDTLIEFLAINTVGPKFDSVDYAPLLTSILKNHCLPSGGSQHIGVSDLNRLSAVVQDAHRLPDQQLRSLADFVVKARIENKKFESAEVQEELAKLQGKVFEDYEGQLNKAKNELNEETRRRQKAEKSAAEEHQTREQLQKTAITERTKSIQIELLKHFALTLFKRFVVVFAVGLVLYLGADRFLDVNISAFALLDGITGIAAFFWWIYSPIHRFRDDYQGASKAATKEIENSINKLPS